jgi:AcrR family transcriptional regulator
MSTKERPAPREAWVREGLELLRSKGIAGVKVVAVAERLGTSRKSFYSHFENLDELLEALLSYWAESHTLEVRDEIEKVSGSPQDRLRHLSALVQRKQATGYDTAVRALVAFNRKAASFVKHVDRVRFDYVESLFTEMGFSESESRTRARIFIHDVVAAPSVFPPRPHLREQERVAVIEKLLEP